MELAFWRFCLVFTTVMGFYSGGFSESNRNPNFALVVGPEGTVSFLDMDNRTTTWSFVSGPPLYYSYQAPSCGYFIDVGDHWELYAYSDRYGKKNLSLDIEEYVNQPHILEDGLSITGSCEINIFHVDAFTGRFLPPCETLEHGKNVSNLGECGSVSNRYLIIKRTDYTLLSFSPVSYKTIWKLRVGKIEVTAGFWRNRLDYETRDMPLPFLSCVMVYRICLDDYIRSSLKSQHQDDMQMRLPVNDDALDTSFLRSKLQHNLVFVFVSAIILFHLINRYCGGRQTKQLDDEERRMKLKKPLDDVDEGYRIGELVVSSTIIAKGNNGTTIFEGVYDGRLVAVKRLILTHCDVALKEVGNLIISDQHPNIVRMYGVEQDQHFVYISLERCICTLEDLIQDLYQDSSSLEVLESRFLVENEKLWKANGPSPLMLKLMRDMISGLAHLHDLRIIHCDLKPQNVLIVKGKSLCAKLSGMGITKRLEGCGSPGWQAPEQLSYGRQTTAGDMFSLGCVLFFSITGGKHPFGDCLTREINIVKNKVDLSLVEFIPEAVDLFSRLLHPTPESRPKAFEVLFHPFFWSPEGRLSFLCDASDRVELEKRKADSDILRAFEGIASVAFGGSWDKKVDPEFLNDIVKYRCYKYDSIGDLLRVIRITSHHYNELSKEMKEILGPVPEGFTNYFACRFPRLLIEVYQVICVHCREESCFQKYFKDDIY